VNVEARRYAVAVSRTGSFSAAAREHGVTQPALSNTIARLEETLGDRLFDRSPRGVSPTAFGQRMLPLIERAVGDLDAIADEARAAASETARTIRLGVSPLIDRTIVSAAFAAMRSLPVAGGAAAGPPSRRGEQLPGAGGVSPPGARHRDLEAVVASIAGEP